MRRFIVLTAAMGFLLASSRTATATVIGFDALADSTIVTNQFAGLTFGNTVVLTAGVSLNETDFPPRSNFNVVADASGPMTIAFGSSVSSVSAYFTYLGPVTFRAFDASHTLLGTATSLFNANSVSGGEPGSAPNELIGLSFAGIRSVEIAGVPGGLSFVMDDLTFSDSANAVPEPTTLLLVSVGGAFFARRLRRSTRVERLNTRARPVPPSGRNDSVA